MALKKDYDQSTRQSSRQQGLTRREASPMSPWRDSPFSLMDRFADEMDRIFENFGFGHGRLAPFVGRGFGQRAFGEGGMQTWSPSIEVFEREGHLVVRADLPGIDRDNVKIDVDDNALTISGERKQEQERHEQGFYHTERSFGSFYRSIPLPEGANPDEAEANFRDGVLEITIPVPERQQRRRSIQIGEGTRSGGRADAQTSGKS